MLWTSGVAVSTLSANPNSPGISDYAPILHLRSFDEVEDLKIIQFSECFEDGVNKVVCSQQYGMEAQWRTSFTKFAHDSLKNLDLPNQHPIDAIEGLQVALDGKADKPSDITEVIVDNSDGEDSLMQAFVYTLPSDDTVITVDGWGLSEGFFVDAVMEGGNLVSYSDYYELSSESLITLPECLSEDARAKWKAGTTIGVRYGSDIITSAVATYPASSGEWRKIRTVTIPEDVTTDTSGVAFLKSTSNDGYTFAFDEDENGNPFQFTELLYKYNATYGNSSTNTKIALIKNSAIPTYGFNYTDNNRANSYLLFMCFNKSTENFEGWGMLKRLNDNYITFGNWGNGGIMANLAGCQHLMPLHDGDDIFTAISLCVSGGAAGFLAGSTFEFYGR